MILECVAGQLEPDRQYIEPELNGILKAIYPDFVLLRRELVDFGYLHRTSDGRAYWKA